MPSQKSAEKAPVHVSIRREVIASARDRLETDGRTLTDLVDHALREYAAGRLALPPVT